MYVSGSKNAQTIQGVNTRSSEIVTVQGGEETYDFESVLSGILSPLGKNEISEEELFAGIIQERIQKLKGSEAAQEYGAALAEEKQSAAGGRFSVEEAARSILQGMQNDGTLSEEEATTIHAQAFKAAQLDDNAEALYDDRGGPNDPTIAVARLEAALLSARTSMEVIDGGESDPGQLSLEIGNTGLPNIRVKVLDDGTFGLPSSDNSDSADMITGSEPMDGAEGFLFKPVSDSNGNLVILLPNALKNQVESVLLKNSAGELLEEGIQSGYGNGDREHFRFSKSGSDFPANLTVEVKLNDGSKQIYLIEDPAKRYD